MNKRKTLFGLIIFMITQTLDLTAQQKYTISEYISDREFRVALIGANIFERNSLVKTSVTPIVFTPYLSGRYGIQ